MEKYIRINNMSKEKLNEVKDALTKLGVSFDTFDYALEVFFNEEADMRLELWEELNPDIEISEKLRIDILDSLESKYFDSEYVINGELLEDITDEIVTEMIDKCNKSC